jgi:hypothetical protein
MVRKAHRFAVMVFGGMALLNPVASARAETFGSEGRVIAAIENLGERPTSLYCSCNNIDGRELVFDLAITNKTAVAQRVYAFVWATNDGVTPPERGLWPLSAVDTCLTETGELDVREPSAGTLVDVPSGDSIRVQENAIVQPIGWFEGQLVSFESLWLQLWSAEGELVFETVVDLGE